MKIAVVGSGIAGLLSAWLFERGGHQVTLLERQPSLGLDSHAVEVGAGEDQLRADVPSRMFNRWQWPHLCHVYELLGIKTKEVDTRQSFSVLGQDTYFQSDVVRKLSVAANLVKNRCARRIVHGIHQLQRSARDESQRAAADGCSLFKFLKQHAFSADFVLGFLYPSLSSTVCTCDYRHLSGYPASVIIEALKNFTNARPLQRTEGGTREVARRLAGQLNRIRLGCEVEFIQETESSVEVGIRSRAENVTSTESYDHLVVATQANHAHRLLPESHAVERSILQQFTYLNVPVVVHRDRSLMPRRQRNWATFNMHISDGAGRFLSARTRRASPETPPESKELAGSADWLSHWDACASDDHAMCTVWLNRYHDEWPECSPLFESILPLKAPAEELVVGKRYLQRPVEDSSARQARRQMRALHRESERRIWFCGSYAGAGIPLLESAVESSLYLAQRFGLPPIKPLEPLTSSPD